MLKEEQAKLQSQISDLGEEKMISAMKIEELEAKVRTADETVSIKPLSYAIQPWIDCVFFIGFEVPTCSRWIQKALGGCTS